MQKIAIFAAAAMSFGLLGGAAYAQATTSPGAGAPTFAQCDKDGSGFVDFTEASACYPGLGQPAFDQADANKDGKLSADEYLSLGGEKSTTGQTNGQGINNNNASSNGNASNNNNNGQGGQQGG